MIKAIETIYNNHRFRSRLEARWAVCMDALETEYRYEMEGFVVNGEKYLPDFFLPGPGEMRTNKETGERYAAQYTHWEEGIPQIAGNWVEIKPVRPTEREVRRLFGLAKNTKHHAYFFVGNPFPGEFEYAWLNCNFHASDGIEFKPFNENLSWDVPIWPFWAEADDMLAAFTMARQARFEHGQTPKPTSLRELRIKNRN